MSTLTRAIELATSAHSGQKRRTGEPYIEHPRRIADRLHGESDTIRMVAWLHDTIEDSDLTLDDLVREGFSDEVIRGVRLLTHVQGQSYLDYLLALRDDKIARVVKLADLEDNLSDSKPGALRDKYELARWMLEQVEGRSV